MIDRNSYNIAGLGAFIVLIFFQGYSMILNGNLERIAIRNKVEGGGEVPFKKNKSIRRRRNPRHLLFRV